MLWENFCLTSDSTLMNNCKLFESDQVTKKCKTPVTNTYKLLSSRKLQ